MSAQDARPRGVLGIGPRIWATLFLLCVGVIATLKLTGAIESPIGMILLLVAMGLLIPFVRSMERSACVNPVIVRYNRRMLMASLGYVLGLGIAVTLWNRFDLSAPIVFAIALLPTLPTFAMIWAMARYLIEEQDEYLRYRTVIAALISLGFVLALGIFYGFLEMFELVPHIWAWWVLPVWAVGLGIGQLWQKVRGA